jgi:hypothetical protein
MERVFPHLPLRGIRLKIGIPQTPRLNPRMSTLFSTCLHIRILPYRLHTQVNAKFGQLFRVLRCEGVLCLELP